MNLLFSINRDFLPLLKTCIRSIRKNGGAERYDAYVLHSDLSGHDMAELIKESHGGVSWHFIHVQGSLFSDLPKSRRYPWEIYYRLAAPLMLPKDLDRILYLDVDTVVINPLGELYRMDFRGAHYLACTHVRRFLTRFNQARLHIKKDVPYVNTGMLLMDLNALRRFLTPEKIYQAARKRSLWLPDQDILTVLDGEHIRLVDPLKYNLSDRILRFYNAAPGHEKRDLNWIRENSVVIHYCGKKKPWKGNYTGILDVFYHETVSEREVNMQ